MNKKAISIFLAAAMTCSIFMNTNFGLLNANAEEQIGKVEESDEATPVSPTSISENPTSEPSMTPTAENPTSEPAMTPTAPTISENPTSEPSMTPTAPTISENPTSEPVMTPTAPSISGEPAETPDVVSAPAISSEKEYTFKKTGNKVTLKAALVKDEAERDYKEYTYHWYLLDKSGKRIDLEGKEQKKAGYKVTTDLETGKSSCVIPKNKPSKAGTYTYVCEVGDKDGKDKQQCEFNVVVYEPVVSINWGSSKTIDNMLGSGKIFGAKKNIKVQKITIAKKCKKYLTGNNKNKLGKLTVNKWFSGKTQVKFTVKQKNNKAEVLNLTVKALIPAIKYEASYSKKKQNLQIKMDKFAFKNIKHIYIMAKGQKWNSKGFKLDTLTYKKIKSKRTIIIPGFTNVIKRVELKFIPNKKTAYSKAWSHNEKSKVSKVKIVKK